MFMGVVADDLTGANDIGIMFRKAGCPAAVLTWDDHTPQDLAGLGDFAGALILNTSSRLDPPELAYTRVHQATRDLAAAGCRSFFKKTCSVFRGPVGAEFDAMLDALGREFAVVVLGFPANGRLTVDGLHYVHGRLLAESEFRSDPTHPMHESDLVRILASQTRRPVASVNRQVIRQGVEALRQHLLALQAAGSYAICDVEDQTALQTIARALPRDAVLCGSSAVAEELPSAWGFSLAPQAVAEDAPTPCPAGRGILVASGSLMPQTRAQVEYLRGQGVAAFELDGPALFDPPASSAHLESLSAGLCRQVMGGRDALLHTSHSPLEIERTRAAGLSAGLTAVETSRRVSAAVAEVCARVMAEAGLDRLVVAGGETSAAVCARLGVRGMRLWKEIQPGLPACLSLPTSARPQPLLLVLKSGSFGSQPFLQEAVDLLHNPAG
jgi:uncharacterized protein YgbK (DUF1537 family)